MPTISPKIYYISDVDSHQIPAFTTTPPECASRLVYSFNPSTNTSPSLLGDNGNYPLSFTPATLLFDLFYNADTNLAGTTSDGKVYTVTVVGTLPGGISEDGDWLLTIKSPCFSTSYISITAVQVPDRSYTLYDTVDNTWQHTPFTVTASATVLGLCGPVVYTHSSSLGSELTYNPSLY